MNASIKWEFHTHQSERFHPPAIYTNLVKRFFELLNMPIENSKISRVQMLRYHSGNSSVPNHHFNTFFALRSLHLILFHLQYLCGRQSGNTRDENDTGHSYWNESDTWLLKSSDSICGTPEGYPAVKILTRIPGWIPWLEKHVSRQKACSIPLKIWYFQNKSSRWQGQWCLYWSPKLFLHPSNLCFPPPIWPWSSAVGYAKIIFEKQTKDSVCEIHRFEYISLFVS